MHDKYSSASLVQSFCVNYSTKKASRGKSSGVLDGVLVAVTCPSVCVSGFGGLCAFLREPTYRTRGLRLVTARLLFCMVVTLDCPTPGVCLC
jgi:hypothetical protein